MLPVHSVGSGIRGNKSAASERGRMQGLPVSSGWNKKPEFSQLSCALQVRHQT
ncbi:hypothetical protein COPCOM_03471 [Coprococcus comes ATCC 27758]|uniref:Uncharacterized protein n=1 Tax=Coprococcus comes ATCC 27758 TaxID=470146 RepID=C0BE58_9FIRM|nr:hypothetical protein COPCOM_03471 [Coprococcus comes ATCC 27758]ERI96959.1 hypothetical protein HMPREF1547_00935 [Blautia sp. KLE 1732]